MSVMPVQHRMTRASLLWRRNELPHRLRAVPAHIRAYESGFWKINPRVIRDIKIARVTVSVNFVDGGAWVAKECNP